jgi:membrane-associated phospholipid phosphatase
LPTGNGLAQAAAQVGRVLIVVAVIGALGLIRHALPWYAYVSAAAAISATLYVVLGRTAGFRPVVLYIVAFAVFAQLRAVADETPIATSFSYVADGDRWLFGGTLPAAWLQDRFYTPFQQGPIDVAAAVVYISYFFVLHALAFWLWVRRRSLFPLYAGAILGTYYAGLAIAFLLPTAPPWLAGQEGVVQGVTRVMEVMAGQLDANTFGRAERVAGVNDVAAMPSLHLAITAVIALMAWRLNRVAGVLGGVYVAAMGLTLVYLGEHYVIDLLTGLVLAMAVWLLACRLFRGDRVGTEKDQGNPFSA